MHIVYPAVVAALLFSIGVYGVLARRNTILVLMSVELMLNAVNLNLVAFDVWLGDLLHSGQVLTLFVIVIAAAEVGVGLAIVLALYRNRRTVDIDHLRDLAEPADPPAETYEEAPADDRLVRSAAHSGGLTSASARADSPPGADLPAGDSPGAAPREGGPAGPGVPGDGLTGADAPRPDSTPRRTNDQPAPGGPEGGSAVRGDGRRVDRGGDTP